ncbi:MAG: acetyl-CoA carboxylase carboxyltransferase subunit alpha [Candidatus Hydrogenedentota bacterium]
MIEYLDFEMPIVEIESKIEEFKKITKDGNVKLDEEIMSLQKKLRDLKKEIFQNLTPWQKTKLARHPKRPYTLDYIQRIFTNFTRLAGDRHFGDDLAIESGIGFVNNKSVMVIGHQKGRDTKENLIRNFGMAHPEGYRKALRLMKLAEKCKIPVITFIDTPGAYPGIGAEERGQAEAIAVNLKEMTLLKTPIISIVIGEGGSGGALGIGLADRIYMLEYAIYSVISPEGCAAILFSDAQRAQDAAFSMRVSADQIYKLGIIDGIIKEPEGGAHRNYDEAANNVKDTIVSVLLELERIPLDELINRRYEKFRKMSVYKIVDNS